VFAGHGAELARKQKQQHREEQLAKTVLKPSKQEVKMGEEVIGR
jgi:hypothetical protein